MTIQEFEISLASDIELTKRTLASKGTEYSANNNRFHNLDKMHILYSLVENKDTVYFPYYALFCKNLVSLIDMMDGKQPITEHMLDEKIGDPINYLFLLKSKMKESINKQGR